MVSNEPFHLNQIGDTCYLFSVANALQDKTFIKKRYLKNPSKGRIGQMNVWLSKEGKYLDVYYCNGYKPLNDFNLEDFKTETKNFYLPFIIIIPSLNCRHAIGCRYIFDNGSIILHDSNHKHEIFILIKKYMTSESKKAKTDKRT